MLVIGVLLGWIARQEAPRPLRRALWLGAAGGLLLAALLGLATFLIRNELEGQILEVFQLCMVLFAAALIVQMVLWMRRHARGMRQELERRAGGAAGALGVGLVTALAVAREGAETVVFLYGLSVGGGGSAPLLAFAQAGAGFLLALLTAWIIARGARLLSYRLVFRISEVLLLLIAAALLANGIDRMIALDWLPPLLDPVWDSSALLADDQGVGRMLAQFVGYRARPCATLLIAYAAYWSFVALALRRQSAAAPAVLPA
ncbi:MAG: FTR1 family protein [Gammaproteobacteria bacterium]|nr:FTR1 family protein [Gammaproteobacteria bacterium]